MTKDVFGKEIKYRFKKLDEDTDGQYTHSNKTIEISDKLSGTPKQLAMLHEEMHAICDVLGFSHILHVDIEELLVDNMSRWICDNYTLRPK